MGTIPKANPELDNTASQVSNVCLGTPLILRQILEQFSNSELIKLSFVNKQWNYEARCLLRNRGALTAKIRSERTCQTLVNFADDLRKMRVVPFSGIHVLFPPFHHNGVHKQISNGSLDPTYKVILERLPWKTFKVDFGYNWEEDYRNCPARVFVEKVLEDFCGVFETLSLTFYGAESFLNLFVNRSFPRVTILKLEAERDNQDLTKLAKALVSCSPNLKELHMSEIMDLFDENVLEGSSAVLVPCWDFNPLYECGDGSLIGALRPKTVEIYRNDGPLNNDALNRFVPMVLRAAVTTLKTLRMDLLFALPLMCYGVCLENVTKLEIGLDSHLVTTLEPSTLKLFKGYDFNRVFPNLNQVELECVPMCTLSLEEIYPFLEQAKAVLQENLPCRAARMKSLILRGLVDASAMAFLAQMFPDVKTLSVEEGQYCCETPYTSLWDHFKNLKELNVINITEPTQITNLDSVICGIFPEEVAELREKDDEYLMAVNIVPVMPSIVCMKELRSFTFRYNPHPDMPWPWPRDHTFLFSKITGMICFARFPTLAVTFQTTSLKCAEALSHMRPYASFTSVHA